MQSVTTDDRWEANRRLDADHNPDAERPGGLCRTCGYGTIGDAARHHVWTDGGVWEVLGGRLRFPPGYPTPRDLLRAGAEHLAAREPNPGAYRWAEPLPHEPTPPAEPPGQHVPPGAEPQLGIADPVVVERADLRAVLEALSELVAEQPARAHAGPLARAIRGVGRLRAALGGE